MTWIVVSLVVLAVLYVLRNGRRNSDPLNRKAAAEICEYLTGYGPGPSEPIEIAKIFQQNARYQSQAKHIASMVPALLANAGIPREVALSAHSTVMEAVRLLPK